MTFLVDTNIFIHGRDGHAAVRHMLAKHAGLALLSTLSLAELQRGLHGQSPDFRLRRQRHEVLIAQFAVVAFDAAAAEAYGRIVANVGRIKSRDIDHMLAGHALSVGATLVTDNEADFADIPGLQIENWTTA